jgi:hypothetical protein
LESVLHGLSLVPNVDGLLVCSATIKVRERVNLDENGPLVA